MTNSLSKSRFLKGLQCKKFLWWSVKEPEAAELLPDFVTQHRFRTGHKVGRIAQRLFTDGKLAGDSSDYPAWIAETKKLVSENWPVIFEAAFDKDGCFAAIDVLERDEDSFNLIEVKSALDVKDVHIDDLSYQAWLLESLGLKVGRIQVMLLNRECRYPNLENILVRIDVTNKVRAAMGDVGKRVVEMRSALDGSLPSVNLGPHCDSPYKCDFKARCWPKLPEHHISTLYKITEAKSLQFEEDGILEVHHLLDDLQLSKIQKRQISSVKANDLVLERELKSELGKLKYPVAYLDFETIGPAIPLWNGCSPYKQIPVQFSCHVEDENGNVQHFEWLSESGDDPRVSMAEPLLAACERAETIVAYSAGVEKGCIEGIADANPHLHSRLINLNDKFFDLLPVVRNNVYHPQFRGSFSIKSVLPALIPDVSHSKLAISEGMTASVWLELLITGHEIVTDRVRLESDLREYCKLDTWAMVLLKRKLLELSR